jgi:hypothetical protein
MSPVMLFMKLRYNIPAYAHLMYILRNSRPLCGISAKHTYFGNHYHRLGGTVGYHESMFLLVAVGLTGPSTADVGGQEGVDALH